jgi:hypothetical protein
MRFLDYAAALLLSLLAQSPKLYQTLTEDDPNLLHVLEERGGSRDWHLETRSRELRFVRLF